MSRRRRRGRRKKSFEIGRNTRRRSNNKQPQKSLSINISTMPDYLKGESIPTLHEIATKNNPPIAKQMGMQSSYYIGMNANDRLITSVNCDTLIERFGSVTQQMIGKYFIFDQNGIQVYPKPPMNLSKNQGEYYVVSKEFIPGVRGDSHSGNKYTFYDLSQAIAKCTELGLEYSIFNQYGNRVY